MYRKLIIGLFAFSTSLLQAQEPETGKFLLSNESKLRINGTSNVTDFSCRSGHEPEADTLSFRIRKMENRLAVTGSDLIMNVGHFDCGQRGINRDFRNTLKYNEYPYIKIKLIGLLMSKDDAKPVEALVEITIADIDQSYTVQLNELNYNENLITVSGSKNLSMKDFNLKKPSPLLGLIKVRDELEIEFDLVIQVL